MPVDVVVLDALPLTAVNKIFKPKLRELAIEKALRETLRKVCGDVDVEVAVAPHPKHGLEARIVAQRPGGSDGMALVQQAEAELGRLPVRWTIDWKPT